MLKPRIPKGPSISELRQLMDKARKIVGDGAVRAWDLGVILNQLFANRAWKRLPEAKDYRGCWSAFTYRHLGIDCNNQLAYRRIARLYKRSELSGVTYGAAKLCANIKDHSTRTELLHCTIAEIQDRMSRMGKSKLINTCSIKPRSRPVLTTLNDIHDFLVKYPNARIELSVREATFVATIRFGSNTYIGRDGSLRMACDASALAFNNGQRRSRRKKKAA
jgi:hypothetical protein